MKSQRNMTIDLAKYIAALFVIGIHTSPFKDVDETLDFFTTQIVFRLAVPFFLMCTGYFLRNRISIGHGRACLSANYPVFVKREKRLVLLYVFWSVMYLFYSIPAWQRTGWFSAWPFVDYAIGAVKTGSHYHLWYLLDLIYALPVLWIATPVLNQKRMLFLSLLLYAVYAIQYGYRFVLPSQLSKGYGLYVFDKLPIGATLFLIIPFLLLGMHIRGERIQRKCRIDWLGFTGSFTLLCIEAFWLRSRGMTQYSYIIFTYPTAYFLFKLLAYCHTEKKLYYTLGQASLTVYCFHPMIVEAIEEKGLHSFVAFMIVAIVSSIVGLLAVRTKKAMLKGKE